MFDIVKSDLPLVIFLMGPTASGKTALALALKKRLSVEIISVDSMLIYRGMNIGTAKPVSEELVLAPHKLIDICDPSEYYSVANFYRDAFHEISNIISNGNIPLLVGGTMFYFKRLLEGLSFVPPANLEVRDNIRQKARFIGWGSLYRKLWEIDPISASKIHPNDKVRLLRALEIFWISGKTMAELTKIIYYKPLTKTHSVYQFAIYPRDVGVLYKQIEQRFYHMLDIGFEDEVNVLYSRADLNKNFSSIRSVGYRQMWSYLSGEIDYDEMVLRAIQATRQLAKHQMTWLRKWCNLHRLSNEDICFSVDKILNVIGSSSNAR
ncbi:tRNA (adenosine(37)-N6)-dimethylallyltransferase MiaA [Blochmannia endosymbiont of Colobopsis nipponica]|uniref:tRNA (adenosine(37)-N6)-dimethylallyltransferase MiaA n=1 Tax=Blochmannia endosymbiont of Colobopsis nipponica TaxID=2681987 RepID=UPI0017859940|nr:tRNA (adenosine(37)-N6)-dimethylallyltransferase MiaA [Blochmannia endosymbiont of Colobopsis nipponica]QOI10774.1 tRNA (adenosine(37)-N6)-dimethylallyltransferase MiaA [Blochmannia endosymbiont of Colobopsis nipponica]